MRNLFSKIYISIVSGRKKLLRQILLSSRRFDAIFQKKKKNWIVKYSRARATIKDPGLSPFPLREEVFAYRCSPRGESHARAFHSLFTSRNVGIEGGPGCPTQNRIKLLIGERILIEERRHSRCR